MEKVYRLLTWLDVGDAARFLGMLTGGDVTAEIVAKLCASEAVPAYVDTAASPGRHAEEDIHVVGCGIQRWLPGGTEAMHLEVAESPAGRLLVYSPLLLGAVFVQRGDPRAPSLEENITWRPYDDPEAPCGCHLMFRPADIEALAAKMNEVAAPPNTSATEIKQQDVEPSPKSRNAYLRTIAALGYALIGGSSGQPHPDADAILAALGGKGIAAPVGPKTLADYLKQAEDT